MAQTLTIGIRELRALVDPVIPSADGGRMALPSLNSVRVEARGKWLTAQATDRFQVAMHRLEAAPDTTWPEWSATVPLATLSAILTTYKPSTRDARPEVTLTIVDDGAGLQVHGAEALLTLTEATITYPLVTGEYPKLREVLRKAIEAESVEHFVGFDPTRANRLLRGVGGTAQMKITTTRTPILFTDGHNFIGALMPRRIPSDDSTATTFPSLSDWSDLLADPKPAKKATRARKAS
jgi:hypothetical protein